MSVKLNFFKLIPSENALDIWRIEAENLHVSFGRLSRAMNQDDSKFISVIQPNNYQGFMSGVYFITTLSSQEKVASEICMCALDYGGIQLEEEEVRSNISLIKEVSSSSFIAGKLLEKHMTVNLEKLSGDSFVFYPSIGFGSQKEVRIPENEKNPYKNYEDCGELFSLNKTLEFHIQHDKDDLNEDALYLVGTFSYRTSSDLSLEVIINKLNKDGIDQKVLEGVKVNYHPPRSHGQICDLSNVEESRITLLCNDDEFNVSDTTIVSIIKIIRLQLTSLEITCVKNMIDALTRYVL